MDFGYALLGAALIVVVLARVRTRHRRHLRVTFTLERKGDDTADATKPPESTEDSGG